MVTQNQADLTRLKGYLVDKLGKTGQFAHIDSNVKIMGPKYNRDILARTKGGQDYVVSTLITEDDYTMEEYREKLCAMSDRGILVAPVVFNNSHFFRLDKHAFGKTRTEYSHSQQSRQMNTREIERFLQKLTDGEVVYFQPKTNNLKVVNYTDQVVSDYTPYDNVPVVDRELERSWDHEIVRMMENFMLTPGTPKRIYRGEGAGRVLVARLVPISLERKIEQMLLF